MDFLDLIIDGTPNLSIITKIELLSWQTEKNIMSSIEYLINESLIINLSDEIVYHCVAIRKKKKIKTPDAIIAATALTNNYTLITSNTKDFNNIKSLKLINPFDI